MDSYDVIQMCNLQANNVIEIALNQQLLRRNTFLLISDEAS